MKVLVVDDSSGIRTKLARLLGELGHTVVGEASNGFEAIELYRRLVPELVTMDIVMPECDGLTALTEIIKSFPQAKVVMVTSAATRSNIQLAQEKGAVGFIVKPFEKEKLTELFKELSLKAA